MLNKIWFWLLVIGLVYGFGKAAYLQYTGRTTESTKAAEKGEAAAEHGTDAESRSRSQKTPTPDPSPEDGGGGHRVDAGIDAVQGAEKTFSPLHAAGKRLSDATLNSATVAVEICIALIGVMALWLGMLAIAREAGLVDALARALRPLMRWLFPDVPDGHPAQGSMLMNISANMLGMGNAATPLGLKAMRELQTLNPTKETATNAMATFMAINTSSVTIIPMTVIALRAANNSASPVGPLAGIILTTAVSTIVAITAVRLLSRLPRFAMPQSGPPDAGGSDREHGGPAGERPSQHQKTPTPNPSPENGGGGHGIGPNASPEDEGGRSRTGSQDTSEED